MSEVIMMYVSLFGNIGNFSDDDCDDADCDDDGDDCDDDCDDDDAGDI